MTKMFDTIVDMWLDAAWRSEKHQSLDVIESKQRPLQLVLGWVTTRIRSTQKPCHTYTCS